VVLLSPLLGLRRSILNSGESRDENEAGESGGEEEELVEDVSLDKLLDKVEGDGFLVTIFFTRIGLLAGFEGESEVDLVVFVIFFLLVLDFSSKLIFASSTKSFPSGDGVREGEEGQFSSSKFQVFLPK